MVRENLGSYSAVTTALAQVELKQVIGFSNTRTYNQYSDYSSTMIRRTMIILAEAISINRYCYIKLLFF